LFGHGSPLHDSGGRGVLWKISPELDPAGSILRDVSRCHELPGERVRQRTNLRERRCRHTLYGLRYGHGELLDDRGRFWRFWRVDARCDGLLRGKLSTSFVHRTERLPFRELIRFRRRA